MLERRHSDVTNPTADGPNEAYKFTVAKSKCQTLRRQLARVRQRERVSFTNPQALGEIDMPATPKFTKAGDNFVLHDSGIWNAFSSSLRI